MKGTTVASLALVALFVTQVTSAHITNAYVHSVQNLKKNTQILKDDLIEYQKVMQTDLNYELIEMKRKNVRLIGDRADRLKKQIRKLVYKEIGKNQKVELCYKKLGLDVQYMHRVLDAELKACSDGMDKVMMPVSDDAQKTIQGCIELQFELDAILRDCTSAQTSEMNKCIAKKLVGAKSTYRKLKLAGTKVKSTGRKISTSAKSSAKLCALKPVSKARKEILNMGVSAKKCIKIASTP